MRKVLSTLMILVALAALSSAEIKFSPSDFYSVNVPVTKNRPLGFISKDPVRNVLWISGSLLIDLNTKGLTTGGITGTRKVDFDKRGSAWCARGDSGLTRTSNGSQSRYLVGTRCFYVFCDKENDQVMVGTTSGVIIFQLNDSGDTVSSSTALSGTIHQVLGSNSMKVAVNTSKVFIALDGKSWTTYDSSNSTISGNCDACAVDKNGNLYVSAFKTISLDRIAAWIAVFNYADKTWSKIEMSSVADSLSRISQIEVDCHNQLWCVFPFGQANIPGKPLIGSLVKMDLATGTIEKSATNGTGENPGLDASGGSEGPVLGLTDEREIIIGGNGVVIFGGSATAVLPRIAPEVRYEFRSIPTEQYDFLGRVISKKTFSIQNQKSAGIHISVYRTPRDLTAVRSLNVK